MKVKIQKLKENTPTPKVIEGNAGIDLTSVTKEFGNGFIEYGTGLAFEIPEGYVGLLFPRSSISNKDLTLANSVGVIDSSYRGEVKLRFIDRGPLHYDIGERIGQLVIMPYPKIELELSDELSSTERGQGGFGSTGA